MENGEWRNGGMEKWSAGVVELWREKMEDGEWRMENGGMEKWSDGVLECWSCGGKR